MVQTLPIFGLGTVLYPGAELVLHVFEPRYRRMVADLLRPEPGGTLAPELGVVALLLGTDTDHVDRQTRHAVGCVAALREVTQLPDGRYALVSEGTDRFRVRTLLQTVPYPVAEVDRVLAAGAHVPAALPAAARRAWDAYVAATGIGAEPALDPDLDGEALSFAIADRLPLPLGERQELLEVPDAATRLRRLHELLVRERTLVAGLGTLPATDVTRSGFSLN